MPQQEIVIVSGLPRSGTSLMMQMLAFGGISPITDEIREADVDNPKGYYEFERVKKIKEDKAWLPDARGKAVKMISQLLYDLPASEHYRVIFMRRDLDEIIASQEKMLKRRNATVPDSSKIKQAFQLHLQKLFEWIPQQESISLMEVDYFRLISEPETAIQSIQQFLDTELDQNKMLTAVDPALYRNRDRTTAS